MDRMHMKQEARLGHNAESDAQVQLIAHRVEDDEPDGRAA
jgi:hypothetical protein